MLPAFDVINGFPNTKISVKLRVSNDLCRKTKYEMW